MHFEKTRKIEKDVEHVGWGDEQINRFRPSPLVIFSNF